MSFSNNNLPPSAVTIIVDPDPEIKLEPTDWFGSVYCPQVILPQQINNNSDSRGKPKKEVQKIVPRILQRHRKIAPKILLTPVAPKVLQPKLPRKIAPKGSELGLPTQNIVTPIRPPETVVQKTTTQPDIEPVNVLKQQFLPKIPISEPTIPISESKTKKKVVRPRIPLLTKESETIISTKPADIKLDTENCTLCSNSFCADKTQRLDSCNIQTICSILGLTNRNLCFQKILDKFSLCPDCTQVFRQLHSQFLVLSTAERSISWGVQRICSLLTQRIEKDGIQQPDDFHWNLDRLESLPADGVKKALAGDQEDGLSSRDNVRLILTSK